MQTKIYGHRGSRGKYPENTIFSMEKAIEEGAVGLEIDVHLTKDNQIVVIHDEDLKVTTNGNGLIKDLTLAEIKKVDAGSGHQVPTLEEVLQLCKNKGIELNIELKTHIINYSGIEKKVLKIASDFNDVKIIYSAFHYPTIHRIKQLDNSATIAFLTEHMLPHPEDYINTWGLEALHIDKDVVLKRPEYFANIYDRLRVWTVNDANEMKKFFELGIVAVMTDYPDVAVKVRNVR